MRIIRLTTLLDFGGQERKYLSFTEDKSLLTNDYIFVAIGYGGNAEKILRERGFQVRVFDSNFQIKNLNNIWKLYKFFRKEKPDVVHTAAGEANFHGIVAAKMARVPVIIGEEIGLPNHSKLARYVFRLIYKLADKVICVSESVKEFLIETGEITQDKGIVIYNPVSQPNVYNKQNTVIFKIVYVGRLEKIKNVGLLIRAIHKLDPLQKIMLQVIGDGREREDLEDLSKNLNLEGIVKFIGFVDEPEKYVSQANLFVLPSLSEGFGIAAAEAMFQGVPCLSSKVGGIPEFIVEGETGWLFDPNKEEELVSKLNDILQMDKASLRKIGENAKVSVENRFSSSIYVKKLEEFYQIESDKKKN